MRAQFVVPNSRKSRDLRPDFWREVVDEEVVTAGEVRSETRVSETGGYCPPDRMPVENRNDSGHIQSCV